MRTWTRLVPTFFLAVPLLLPSACAADDAELNAKKIERLQDEVKALRANLDELKEIVRRIDQRTDSMTQRRESLYGPPAQPLVPAPTRATITLQNDYSAPATIRINGIPYRVEPFSTRSLAGVPVGPFNYEVDVQGFGVIEPVRTENLMPTGHRFRIYPR